MKSLEHILSPEELRSFGINIFRGPFEEVKKIIEEKNIDANSVYDEKRNQSLLSDCIRGAKYGSDNLKLAAYLLEKGANPNIQDSSRNSAFHEALYLGNLDMIELLLQYEVEVNQKSGSGYSSFFGFLKFVYEELADKGIPLKKRCLVIVEEMLKRGADIDLPSSYGTTPRTFYFNELASVHALFDKYDKLALPKQSATEQGPPSNLKHPKVCKEIWAKFVPKNGAADTVVGELLRAIEKLRDEAQRNGNMNYDDWHKSLAIYVRDTLIGYNLFDEKEIKDDIKVLMYKTKPYLEDDIYDRFCDRIAEVYLKFPEPVYR